MTANLTWELLEVGKTRRDAGALFGETPRVIWQEHYIPPVKDASPNSENFALTRSNRIAIATNVTLIIAEDEIILIDAGTPVLQTIGESDEWSGSTLRKMLSERKILPRDITKIILTSPDIDHAGGLAHHDRSGNLVPAFPNAKVYYHKTSNIRCRPHTIDQADLAFQQIKQCNLEPSASSTEVAPGIFMHPINGPSNSGSVAEIRRGADRVLFLGDLCPTILHLNQDLIPSFDDTPDDTFTERQQWLMKAKNEGHMVVFGHGVKAKAGWVEERRDGILFKAIEK